METFQFTCTMSQSKFCRGFHKDTVTQARSSNARIIVLMTGFALQIIQNNDDLCMRTCVEKSLGRMIQGNCTFCKTSVSMHKLHVY